MFSRFFIERPVFASVVSIIICIAGAVALFAMPVAFLLAYIFSKTDSSARAKLEIDAFEDQYVRGQTGFGASSASNH